MIHIIIVSHGHDKYIFDLFSGINSKSENYRIYVKDNIKSKELEIFCSNRNIDYIVSEKILGFGGNNNFAVNYICSNGLLGIGDYYLFLNPDILISEDVINKLYDIVSYNKYSFATICLYKDREFKTHDYSIRNYPRLNDFFSSFFFSKNATLLDKDNIDAHTVVDWCSGAFMLISSDAFHEVRGFDEEYFMYCEDIDLCFRLNIAGHKLVYLPELKAVHFAQHTNRNIFSKSFFWHVKSIYRYLSKRNLRNKYNLSKIKSCL